MHSRHEAATFYFATEGTMELFCTFAFALLTGLAMCLPTIGAALWLDYRTRRRR